MDDGCLSLDRQSISSWCWRWEIDDDDFVHCCHERACKLQVFLTAHVARQIFRANSRRSGRRHEWSPASASLGSPAKMWQIQRVCITNFSCFKTENYRFIQILTLVVFILILRQILSECTELQLDSEQKTKSNSEYNRGRCSIISLCQRISPCPSLKKALVMPCRMSSTTVPAMNITRQKVLDFHHGRKAQSSQPSVPSRRVRWSPPCWPPF